MCKFIFTQFFGILISSRLQVKFLWLEPEIIIIVIIRYRDSNAQTFFLGSSLDWLPNILIARPLDK